MTDYIFEIKCYEKGNLLKEFAEYCGYHLGLYHFYNDHVVVDFLTDKEFNKTIQQPIQFKMYAFTIKPSFVNTNLHNKVNTKIIKDKWRTFLSSKFSDYKEDLQTWLHEDYVL